jgi:hypothetical protein
MKIMKYFTSMINLILIKLLFIQYIIKLLNKIILNIKFIISYEI